MSRVFTCELKRAINPGFIIAVIGAAFCICFDSWNDLIGAIQNRKTSLCVYYFMENSAFGGMCRNYILPVFAVLPFATSFCDERNGQAAAYIASREGMRRYSAVKYVVNAIIGGLAVAFGTVLLILLLRTGLPMTSSDFRTSGVADVFHSWIAIHHPLQYCLTEAALGFMRGMIWASAALTVSLYITDKFVITMFPFLGSYVITRVSQLLMIDNNFRFDMILIGRTVIRNSGYTVMVAAVISGILVLIIGCIFSKKMMKGLKNGTFYKGK